MPKAAKTKYYAVKIGKEGPKIYDSWDEVSRYPGAIHKAFSSLSQAEQWLGIQHNQDHNDSSTALQRLPTPGDGADPDNAIVISDSESEHSMVPPEEVPAVEPEIQLSPEQQQVFNMVKAGRSVFFTGAAGTGKSVLLREIIKWCRGGGKRTACGDCFNWDCERKEKAEHLLGKILGQDKYRRMKERQERERLGLPPDENDLLSEHDNKYEKNPRVVERWRKVQVLIVDEISMIDGILFDKLEFLARSIRRNQLPFGGIQLVLSGDFCQLPPVPDRFSKVATIFSFDAKTWDSCVGKPVTLRKVFRQKEQAFVDMLNSMRFGQLTPPAIKTFRDLSREVVYNDGLVPTELFPTRAEVDRANTERLNKIPGDGIPFPAIDVPGWEESGQRISAEKADKLLNNLIAQKFLTLKVGAQVMLIKNLVQGSLVNGTIGRVVGFATTRDALNKGTWIGVADNKGDKSQVGLLQGQDGDKKNKPPGSETVQQYLRSGRNWPIVKFSGGEEVLCVPAQFEVTNAEGLVQARRDQVPLILAWALSIHKSQGQTLERVRVDLGRIFEKGQAYVALSRATSIDRLQVLHFDPGKVMAHQRVLEWMREHGGLPNTVNLPHDDIDEELEFWGDDF
ncbi:hypothetical protein NM688_g2009 [Phlebia brevispora]|uniref:Uncharacterized protein n=1 Tax=Phlebia brevispora TaxID=194682 RepID=A0ACC1T9W7_9APHY|nr:hypothetical protein NM688_g2009 [Phlebia brevispora]